MGLPARADLTTDQRLAVRIWLQNGVSDLDSQLKDLGSARFKDIRLGATTGKDGQTYFWLCGAVNAKNTFGAYAGWSGFVVSGWPAKAEFQDDSAPGEGLTYRLTCETGPKTIQWDSGDWQPQIEALAHTN